MREVMGVPVMDRGVPVPGTGKRGRRLRFSGHGLNAAIKSVKARKVGCCLMRRHELKRSGGACGPAQVKVNVVEAITVQAVHCTANALWVDGKMAVLV